MTTGPEQAAAWVSPDGSGILGREFSSETQHDILWFPLRRSGRSASSSAPPPERLLATPFIEFFPEVSPNGRYLAYQSNLSGRDEIYVRPFPRVQDGEWRVSPGGGTHPAWAKDGRELFYLDPSVALTAVPVDTSGPGFTFGNPASLFELTAVPESLTRDYDVAADGRFLIVKSDVRAVRTIVVSVHWVEELKAKAR